MVICNEDALLRSFPLNLPSNFELEALQSFLGKHSFDGLHSSDSAREGSAELDFFFSFFHVHFDLETRLELDFIHQVQRLALICPSLFQELLQQLLPRLGPAF